MAEAIGTLVRNVVKATKGQLAATEEVICVGDQVNKVEEDVAALQTRADKIDDQADRVESEVEEMKTKVDRTYMDISRVDGDVGKVKRQVDAVESGMEDMKGWIGSNHKFMNGRVDHVEGEVEKVKVKAEKETRKISVRVHDVEEKLQNVVEQQRAMLEQYQAFMTEMLASLGEPRHVHQYNFGDINITITGINARTERGIVKKVEKNLQEQIRSSLLQVHQNEYEAPALESAEQCYGQ